MTANLCYCGHIRALHDPCSLCGCPWFLSVSNEGARDRWRIDKEHRALTERDIVGLRQHDAAHVPPKRGRLVRLLGRA